MQAVYFSDTFIDFNRSEQREMSRTRMKTYGRQTTNYVNYKL